MSFFLEVTDLDFGDTPIENIFINDYMPMADGTYVKVYLLGYKYAKDDDEKLCVNNESISRQLNIPLTDVLKAWDFWEQKGIIVKHKKEDADEYDYKVEFLNLKQLYIKNNYVLKSQANSIKNNTSIYTCTAEDLVESNKIPSINEMFTSIDYIVRRQLVPNEKRKVLEWLYNYNMSPEVIVKAFFYAVEQKGKRNINYVEGIVRNWYDMGITNLDMLEKHSKTQDERFYSYDRIMKSLGFSSRTPSEAEMKVIDKWFDEWKFTMEVILKACENTKKTANPSVNYIDGILSKWKEKGISSVDDIAVKDKPQPPNYQSSNSTASPRGAKAKTRFHTAEQRTAKYTPEELEAIARKRRG
ncbi:putative DNA replication protein DnaD [Proteiniborus sp. DW1]|nr:putative DNA replication protein DnaD [Proteiniborus sp. DW1]